MTIIVHDWPLPIGTVEYTIGVSNWSEETKAQLSGHDCFALVTCTGEAEPIEKMLALYRVGVALTDQGAIGIANEAAWSCYPAEVLEAFRTSGMWESLRTEGLPAEFLVGTVRFMANEQKWLASKGHHLFGLPELAFEVQNDSQVAAMSEIFQNLFYYLYKNGPVIEAGQTVEIEGGATLRFVPSPIELEFLTSPGGTLLVELDGELHDSHVHEH